MFSGKGYRLFLLKRNSLIFNFGFSHFFLFYNFQLYTIILSKVRILFFGLNFFTLRANVSKFFNIKPLNIFTSKGVRFFKQVIYKRVGKLSTYF